MFRARLLPPTTEQKQQKLEEKTNKFFSVQLFFVSTQAPEFIVQVSPSVTCNGLLVEVLSLSCKRVVKFSETLFVLSFGFFRCLTGALICGFMSSFIIRSFNKILKKTILKKT